MSGWGEISDTGGLRYTRCSGWIYREGKDFREKAIGGTTDPTAHPKDFQGSPGAPQTKTADGVQLTSSLYTGVVTDEEGEIIFISKEEAVALERRREGQGTGEQRSHYIYDQTDPGGCAGII